MSNRNEANQSNSEVYTQPAEKKIILKGINDSYFASCYSLCGQTLFSKQIENDEIIKLPDSASGIYVLNLHNEAQHYTCKIIL